MWNWGGGGRVTVCDTMTTETDTLQCQVMDNKNEEGQCFWVPNATYGITGIVPHVTALCGQLGGAQES